MVKTITGTKTRVGIIGGTFDPIHLGHLIISEEARVRLGLSYIVFLPAGQPYLKADRAITAADHRVAMINLAISSNPDFKLSTLDVERPGSTYTVDTLRLIGDQGGVGAHHYLILGWDSLNGFPRWKEPARIISMSELLVLPRFGFPRPDMRQLEEAIPGVTARTIMLDMAPIGISATEIRRRVSQGISIRYLVPWEVERYIMERKLYTMAD